MATRTTATAPVDERKEQPVFDRLRRDFAWRNYQGDRDELAIGWTDTNRDLTLYDTVTDGMVLSNEANANAWDPDEFVPDSDVWMFKNDDLPGGLE